MRNAHHVFSLLLDHMKKFPVNATGGLMLTKSDFQLPSTSHMLISLVYRDLKSYQDMIATFNCPALSERFEFICQLGKIFLIEPEILKSYINESALARIEPHLLRPYLAQRSDWQAFENRFDGPGGGLPGLGEEAYSAAETKKFRDRLGMSRLSTMMKELEGLKIGEMGSNLSGGFSFAHRFTS